MQNFPCHAKCFLKAIKMMREVGAFFVLFGELLFYQTLILN